MSLFALSGQLQAKLDWVDLGLGNYYVIIHTQGKVEEIYTLGFVIWLYIDFESLCENKNQGNLQSILSHSLIM